MIKIGVKIQFRKEVLDTAGRALLKLFQSQKKSIKACGYGKYIELDIDEKDEKAALKLAEEVAKDVLSNDLIETFELEVIR